MKIEKCCPMRCSFQKGKRTKENSAGRANAAAVDANKDAKAKGNGKKRAAEAQPPAEGMSWFVMSGRLGSERVCWCGVTRCKRG